MEKGTSEIAKLTERISKDPKSKLFVPLAEEYKKAGDIEMAIYVLSEGLKNNPGYVTARSLLGRLLLERGDLDAARKELDEVVKAIPDNLLAQRRLGDLYVLQDNRTEALKHYKIALALNPGDAEFASLVADAEAGLDIRPRLQQQKTKKSPEPAGKPKPASAFQQQAKSSTVPPVQPAAKPGLPRTAVSKDESGPAPSSVAHAAEKAPLKAELAPTVEPQETKAPKPGETAAKAGPREDKEEPAKPAEPAGPAHPVQESASSSPRQEPEEPEEVLAVEPIEDESPSGETLSSGFESPSEKIDEGIPAFAVDERSDVLSTAHEEPVEEPELLLETKAVSPVEAEETTVVSSDEVAAVPLEPESSAEKGTDQSDDFTTDTLAELYIAQGFYEKAIDIYQRMLADHPDSKGLKEKLERVRALAAHGESSHAETGSSIGALKEKADAGFPDFAEPKEFGSLDKALEATEGVPIPAEEKAGPVILAEPREYIPPSETAEKEEEITIEAELFVEPEGTGAKTETAGASQEENIFAEPKEYRPTAETEPGKQAPVKKEPYDIFMPGPDQESVRPKPHYADFEPREYIPPDAELRAAKAEKVQVASKQSAATRKETIDRLENWLKNIKKEK